MKRSGFRTLYEKVHLMPIFRDVDGRDWSIPEQAMLPVDTHTPTPPAAGPMTLTVDGARIMHGPDRWYAAGANIFDTRGCNACTWSDPDVDEVKRRMTFFAGQGARLFRLCLESYGQAGGRTHYAFGTPGYLDDIVAIVEHARTLGCWVLVALWVDDTFDAEWVPTPDTLPRLRQLGERLADHDNALIGCCNEPTRNWDNADTNRRIAVFRDCVATIRDTGFSGLIAVQGLSGWGRDLSPYVDSPIDAPGVIYETHIYGPPEHYDSQVDAVRNILPVIIGEYGPMVGLMTTDQCAIVAGRAYDDMIPNCAWSAHQRCGPEQAMLVDYSAGGCGSGMDLELTPWGTQCAEHWQL